MPGTPNGTPSEEQETTAERELRADERELRADEREWVADGRETVELARAPAQSFSLLANCRSRGVRSTSNVIRRLALASADEIAAAIDRTFVKQGPCQR